MGVAAPSTSASRLTRLVPILDWSRRYDRRWLRGDLIAGVAVAAMIVPKNLGYAGIAGIPVENGLYAAAAAAIIYAIFCTSRHISTGPSSSLAAVAGGAVLVTGSSGIEAAQLVAAIAIATGALFLLVAILKLGWLASFLSRAVVTGFLAGAAIDVVIGELPKLTGTSSDGVNAWQELASWARGLDGLSVPTLFVGIVALAVILGLRFRLPKVPGALVLVVGGLVASVLFDLGARGVALVGTVPRGLPVPQLPPLELVSGNLPTVVIAAFALLLIGFSQTAGDAQAFATKHRYRVDLNQESVAQGMANLGAGVFQGMPVSTSLSASSLNESAGARTPVASLATGAVRPRDAGPARAPVLRAPQGRPGRDHHRCGRVRDDRPRRVPPASSREALRLLDRHRGGPRGALGRGLARCRRRYRAVAALADPGRDPADDADPRS